jgi:hypothetical protein
VSAELYRVKGGEVTRGEFGEYLSAYYLMRERVTRVLLALIFLLLMYGILRSWVLVSGREGRRVFLLALLALGFLLWRFFRSWYSQYSRYCELLERQVGSSPETLLSLDSEKMIFRYPMSQEQEVFYREIACLLESPTFFMVEAGDRLYLIRKEFLEGGEEEFREGLEKVSGGRFIRTDLVFMKAAASGLAVFAAVTLIGILKNRFVNFPMAFASGSALAIGYLLFYRFFAGK